MYMPKETCLCILCIVYPTPHAPRRPTEPPYLNLPPFLITLATGQGVVYSPSLVNTIATSPRGETEPVMLLQARVLWRAGWVDAVRRVLTDSAG